MSQNVQQYSKEVYLRASEAQQCQIQSTIVLPLFDSHVRKHSIGVLEVVQTANDMPFAYVISTLDAILQVCSSQHLSLSGADEGFVSGMCNVFTCRSDGLTVQLHHHACNACFGCRPLEGIPFLCLGGSHCISNLSYTLLCCTGMSIVDMQTRCQLQPRNVAVVRHSEGHS